MDNALHTTRVCVERDSFVRVANVKYQHLQDDLLTAVICWTNPNQSTAVVAVNSIASLGVKIALTHRHTQ